MEKHNEKLNIKDIEKILSLTDEKIIAKALKEYLKKENRYGIKEK